ncbi:HAD-IA family hydrolase [Lysobacter enzymogenes]|uniref:HAD-IA family hydrolase n=1 Tax=Lysobacter enzymogenes TaxID=69 RepID=UPI001A95A9D5|nr:HAD-IA family hydrolase [Lysobacter enzymogenes]QQP95762.1 HAD-IA family hydrolase [Lysobacter enzymogenes]
MSAQRPVLFFDLDGTLIDSSVGITRSIAYALETLHHPVPDAQALRGWIGPALRTSFQPLLGDDDKVEQAVALYLERYAREGWTEHSVYDGIAELLDGLRAAGYRMAVVTAKNEGNARLILSHLPFGAYFEDIVGSTEDGRLTHKVELIAEALQRFGLQPAQCVMIGDRSMDMDGAAQHGMAGVGVLWGFGSEQELREAGAQRIALAPAQLPELLAA